MGTLSPQSLCERSRRIETSLRSEFSAQTLETHRALVAALVAAGGIARDGPGSEGLLGPVHAARALNAFEGASPPGRAALDRLLERAGTPLERGILLKAIAFYGPDATSKEAMAALERLAQTIRGKPAKWILAKSTAYRTHQANKLSSFLLDGCCLNVTRVAWLETDTAELVHQRSNPLRGFVEGRTHEWLNLAVFGPTSSWVLNGCFAAARAVLSTLLPPGWVRRGGSFNLHQSLTPLGAGVGAAYDYVPAMDAKGRPTVDLNHIEDLVLDGYDIPIIVATVSGNDMPRTFHAMLIVDVQRDEDGRKWIVHEPELFSRSPVVRDDDLINLWRDRSEGRSRVNHVVESFVVPKGQTAEEGPA
ncbi:MAG: hypothetical protein AAF654_11470 [Myxococcota bacterium]